MRQGKHFLCFSQLYIIQLGEITLNDINFTNTKTNGILKGAIPFLSLSPSNTYGALNLGRGIEGPLCLRDNSRHGKCEREAQCNVKASARKGYHRLRGAHLFLCKQTRDERMNSCYFHTCSGNVSPQVTITCREKNFTGVVE